MISNSGGFTNNVLTKAGAGTLRLTGANTYATGTVITAGTLVTGNASALGSGAVTLAGGTLHIGSGAATSVTLGAGQNIVTTAAVSVLKFDGLASAITLTGGGKYDFSAGALTLDLSGAFNNAGTYALITGGTANVDAAAYTFAGADTTNFGFAFANGVLSVSVIPEPSAYGLLGAGALAAVAAVRRRRAAKVVR